MMDWIISNKEWLFSGVLVAVPIALVGLYFSRKSGKKVQYQKSGKNSRSFQAGNNIEIGSRNIDE